MAAADNLEISQFDCKTAFLNGELEESIFMVQPEGYNDESGCICKLIRSLYGLKQAPGCWNRKLSLFLNSIGFNSSLFDPCVFSKQDNGKLMIIAVYVDDGLILANRKEDIAELLCQLKNKFEITICNKVSQFLGFQIELLDNGDIKIHQTAYTGLSKSNGHPPYLRIYVSGQNDPNKSFMVHKVLFFCDLKFDLDRDLEGFLKVNLRFLNGNCYF